MTASIKKKKKSVEKDGHARKFSRDLGSVESRDVFFCGDEMQAVRKSAHFWPVEGSKRPREGGEEGGVSFNQLPVRPTSPPIITPVISQWAGRVSRTRRVSPSVESEKESECVWTFLFFMSQLISVRRRINGLREFTHFTLTPMGKLSRDPGFCSVDLFLVFILS